MSLDVYLKGDPREVHCECDCGHEHTRTMSERLFHANITHNLNGMADEAGIYGHLWKPNEIGVTKAREMIEPLRAGLALMELDPDRFRKYEPANKWGTYDDFVPWIKRYLAACEEFPDANVSVWR